MDISWTHVIVQLRRNRVGFGDLLTLQALTLQHVQEVCVATHIQLTGPFQTHSALTHKMGERGVRLERTSQLNVGGNTDFLNMLERELLDSKKISKTNSVTSQLDYDMGPGNVHIGPSDYVEWLDDRKWAYIRMEGRTFGDVPLNMELKLEVVDSPNSAGIVIDAVRCAKLALDR